MLQLGINQSRLPEPMSAASVLMLHDGVELFLQVACEHLNVGKADLGFMDYFSLIDKKLAPKELAHRESMRRLNNSRKGLKHHGTLPSALDVEGFRAAAAEFFRDNMPVVFQVPVEAVSLADLVSAGAAREALQMAEQHLEKSEFDRAVDQIAVAFEQLMREHGIGRSHRLPHDVPIHLHRLGSGTDPQLSRFLEGVAKSLSEIEGEIAMLRRGLDTRRLALFKHLTPSVALSLSGAPQVRWLYGIKPTAESARFCFDFTVEAALHLQQTDLPGELLKHDHVNT